MVMELTCHCCTSTNLAGNEFQAHCRDCGEWTSSRCWKCKDTSGFPHHERWATDEQMRQFPLMKHVSTENAEKEVTISARKSGMFCRECYHNHYALSQDVDQYTCVICNTSWQRGDMPVHVGG